MAENQNNRRSAYSKKKADAHKEARRAAREAVLALLFETEYHKEENPETIFLRAAEARGIDPADKYIRAEYMGIMENLTAIDAILGRHAKGWRTDRLSRVSRAVLRLGAYEIIYAEKIPAPIAINEAVELAKKFDAYMAQEHLSDVLEDGTVTVDMERPVAYFSTEFGMHESLQLYSGGLGVLSGDHMKSSSDERLPLIGVGLFYLNGYFQQTVDKKGHQNPVYPENHPASLPLEAMLDEKGAPLMIGVPLGSRTLYARIWKVQVGLCPLYLMDTNVPENTDDDRRVTARLYEADRDVRMRQEILLGMGGVRMLRALGMEIFREAGNLPIFIFVPDRLLHFRGESVNILIPDPEQIPQEMSAGISAGETAV